MQRNNKEYIESNVQVAKNTKQVCVFFFPAIHKHPISYKHCYCMGLRIPRPREAVWGEGTPWTYQMTPTGQPSGW